MNQPEVTTLDCGCRVPKERWDLYAHLIERCDKHEQALADSKTDAWKNR